MDKRKYKNERKQEIIDIICEDVAEGGSVREACRDLEIERMTVLRWMRICKSKDWSDEQAKAWRLQYEQAIIDRTDFWADEMVRIANDDTKDVIELNGKQALNSTRIGRDSLKISTVRWNMGKQNSPKYGDNVKAEITVVKEQPLFSSPDE